MALLGVQSSTELYEGDPPTSLAAGGSPGSPEQDAGINNGKRTRAPSLRMSESLRNKSLEDEDEDGSSNAVQGGVGGTTLAQPGARKKSKTRAEPSASSLNKPDKDSITELKAWIKKQYPASKFADEAVSDAHFEGWSAVSKARAGGAHVDRYYIAPNGKQLRSRLEVARYIGADKPDNTNGSAPKQAKSANGSAAANGGATKPKAPSAKVAAAKPAAPKPASTSVAVAYPPAAPMAAAAPSSSLYSGTLYSGTLSGLTGGGDPLRQASMASALSDAPATTPVYDYGGAYSSHDAYTSHDQYQDQYAYTGQHDQSDDDDDDGFAVHGW